MTSPETRNFLKPELVVWECGRRFNLSRARREREESDLLLSNDLSRVLIRPQADELDVANVVRVRPFEEFEIRNQLGLYPNALSHLRGGQSLTHLPLFASGKFTNGHCTTIRGFKRA